MARLFLLLTFGCLALCQDASIVRHENVHSFEQFKQVFSKEYSTLEEEAEAKVNFEKNLKFVTENQDNENGVQLGLNEYSDLSDEDFFALSNDLDDEDLVELDSTETIDEYSNIPASWDWRNYIQLNPIEQQGRCGSCWAFAAVLTVEAQFAIHQNKLIHLSKQELVDCSMHSFDATYRNQGCKFGYTADAMKYMKQHGVYEESLYPYKADNETCHLARISSTDHSNFKITDYGRLAYNGTDLGMMTVVANNGPVVVNIMEQDPIFRHYKSGIIRNLFPQSKKTSHSVTLLGYGTENGTDYWLVRNSWGPAWGDHGHAKIERGNNLMGINNWPVFPILH